MLSLNHLLKKKKETLLPFLKEKQPFFHDPFEIRTERTLPLNSIPTDGKLLSWSWALSVNGQIISRDNKYRRHLTYNTLISV